MRAPGPAMTLKSGFEKSTRIAPKPGSDRLLVRVLATLHNPKLLERRLRAHPFLDRLPPELLAARLLECAREHLLFGGARHDADAVDVAEQDVARLDARGADLDGDAEVDHFAARSLVLGVGAVAEGGKVEGEDAVG